MRRMQKHLTAQLDELRADPTLAQSQDDVSGTDMRQRVLDMYRPLTDADIDRVRLVQTSAELLDCSHHFHLHYGGELAAMREFEARTAALNKNKPAKEKKKKKKKKRRAAGEGEDDEHGEDEIDDDDEEEDDDEAAEDEEEEEPEDEPDEEGGADAKVIKYASKKDRYHHCKLAGLCGLAKKFGLTPEQLGENLECDYQKHEIEQCAIAPSDEALSYAKEPYFTSTDQVNCFGNN